MRQGNIAPKVLLARCSTLLLLLLVAVTFMADVGDACPGSFFATLVKLTPCKMAVSPDNPLPPSDACCGAVKAVGQRCLCLLVNGPPISGIDRNMAMQLPDMCAANFEPCKIGQ